MASTVRISPISKIIPGITAYINKERTMVITGDSPVSGTTTMALHDSVRKPA